MPVSQQVSRKRLLSFQGVALTLTFPHCRTDPGAAVGGDNDTGLNPRVFAWSGAGQASSSNTEMGTKARRSKQTPQDVVQ